MVVALALRLRASLEAGLGASFLVSPADTASGSLITLAGAAGGGLEEEPKNTYAIIVPNKAVAVMKLISLMQTELDRVADT
jgi:hypothetical protein